MHGLQFQYVLPSPVLFTVDFFIRELLCNFLVRTLQYLKKNCPKKVEKNTLKSRSEILKKNPPQLPKWPKQKNSCSNMQLIDQLYKKLGCQAKCKELFTLSYQGMMLLIVVEQCFGWRKEKKKKNLRCYVKAVENRAIKSINLSHLSNTTI